MMKRLAFKMHLKEGQIETYKKRHQETWPELKNSLKASGISGYSIFFDKETSTLFAFQRISEGAGSQNLGHLEIVKQWWKYMSDIMDVNEDFSPVTTSLEEVFFME